MYKTQDIIREQLLWFQLSHMALDIVSYCVRDKGTCQGHNKATDYTPIWETSQEPANCPLFHRKGTLSPQNPTSSTTLWLFLAIYAIKMELKRTGLWKNRAPSFLVPKPLYLFSSTLPEEISIKLAKVIAKPLIDKTSIKLTHANYDSLFKMLWLECIIFTYGPPSLSLLKNFSSFMTSRVTLPERSS